MHEMEVFIASTPPRRELITIQFEMYKQMPASIGETHCFCLHEESLVVQGKVLTQLYIFLVAMPTHGAKKQHPW